MKQRVPVSQIMSKDVVTIDPTKTLYEAEALFKKHHIRHIPVVEGHKLIGVLRLTDLLRISFADLSDDEKHVDSVVYDMFTIPQVMAKVPLSISPDTTIKEAAEILAGQTRLIIGDKKKPKSADFGFFHYNYTMQTIEYLFEGFFEPTKEGTLPKECILRL